MFLIRCEHFKNIFFVLVLCVLCKLQNRQDKLIRLVVRSKYGDFVIQTTTTTSTETTEYGYKRIFKVLKVSLMTINTFYNIEIRVRRFLWITHTYISMIIIATWDCFSTDLDLKHVIIHDTRWIFFANDSTIRFYESNTIVYLIDESLCMVRLAEVNLFICWFLVLVVKFRKYHIEPFKQRYSKSFYWLMNIIEIETKCLLIDSHFIFLWWKRKSQFCM